MPLSSHYEEKRVYRVISFSCNCKEEYMKKVFAIFVVASLAITMAAAQSASPPAVKLGGVLEVDSILAGTDDAASNIISILSFDLNAGNFGAVLGFKPSATLTSAAAIAHGGLGTGYDVSPFSIIPDDFYLWTMLFDGKAKLSVGQIGDGTFGPHAFIFGGNVVNKIATSDVGQGIDVQVFPIDNLKIGVYVPLSEGENAYKDLSMAAEYNLNEIAIVDAGFIGNNKGMGTVGSTEDYALFASAQLTAVQNLAAYVAYEYTTVYYSRTNQSNIAAGARYTGIKKIALAADAEAAFADADVFGYQVVVNGEYSIQGPYAAGLTAVYNENAGYTINAGSIPWADGQIGDDNCLMFEPYFAINPMGPPPFAKVTVGFQAFYQVDDYTTGYGTAHSAGAFYWAIPVCVTVIM
jgi:hypothetical protein